MKLVIEGNSAFLKKLEKDVFTKLDPKERQRFEVLNIRDKNGKLKVKETPTAVGIAPKFYIYDDVRQEKVACYWIKGENVADANSNRDKITILDKFYFRRATGLGVEFVEGTPFDSELRKMLLIHPQNSENRGKFFHIPPKGSNYQFREYNKEKIATSRIDLLEKQTEARAKIKDLEEPDVMKLCAALFPTRWESMSHRAMKLALYEMADKSPERVIVATKGTVDHARSVVARALKNGLISKDNNTINWSDGTKIASFSTAKGKIEDQFADFIIGERGTYDKLEEELKLKEEQ